MLLSELMRASAAPPPPPGRPPPPRVGEVGGGGVVFPVGLSVNHAEDAFGAGHGDQGLVVLGADRGDGGEELIREEEERDKAVEGHVAVEHAPAAEHEEDGDEELAVEFEKRREFCGGAGEGDVVAGVLGEEAAEESEVGFLTDEALRDAHAADGFGERGSDAAEALAGGARLLAQLHPKVVVDEPEDWSHRGNDEEHGPVLPSHDDGGDEHAAELDD